VGQSVFDDHPVKVLACEAAGKMGCDWMKPAIRYLPAFQGVEGRALPSIGYSPYTRATVARQRKHPNYYSPD